MFIRRNKCLFHQIQVNSTKLNFSPPNKRLFRGIKFYNFYSMNELWFIWREKTKLVMAYISHRSLHLLVSTLFLGQQMLFVGGGEWLCVLFSPTIAMSCSR